MHRVKVRVLLQQNSMAHYRRALYQRLAERSEVEIDFLFDAESDTPFMETATPDGLGGRVVLARVWTFFGRRLPALSLQPKALWQAVTGRYDIVIALGSPYCLTTWGLLLLSSLARFRVLLWTHGLLRAESGPKWWVRRTLYRLSDGLLLYGERGRSLLVKAGLDPKGLHVIFNSLDDGLQQESARLAQAESVERIRDSLGCSDAERVIVFIGRLQPVKELHLILLAVSQLRERGHGVHVVFVGEGSEEERLRALASELRVTESVHFLGACHEEAQIARVFRVADVCAVPAGAGLTVVHALGYATPVVTHDDADLQFPEVEAIEPGATGVLFRHGELASFVDALASVLYPRPLKEGLDQRALAGFREKFNAAEQARRMAQACIEAMQPRCDEKTSHNPRTSPEGGGTPSNK